MALNERVQEELEALEAIFMDDIIIKYDDAGYPELVKSTIFPSTADDVEKQYVCVTMEAILPPEYPDCVPVIQLKNPRGIDDDIVNNLYSAIKNKCIEFLGEAVIYELIELIRGSLTESNLPTCQCVVCLYGFSEGDSFTKTPCFHYFHSYCLSKHVITTERLYQEEQDKLPAWQKSTKCFAPCCPVCRETITCDVEQLKKTSPPKELQNAQNFKISNDLKELQANMKKLYIYQKNKGGIIDIEAQENKLLLITESPENSTQDPGTSVPNNTMMDTMMSNQRYDTRQSFDR